MCWFFVANIYAESPCQIRSCTDISKYPSYLKPTEVWEWFEISEKFISCLHVLPMFVVSIWISIKWRHTLISSTILSYPLVDTWRSWWVFMNDLFATDSYFDSNFDRFYFETNVKAAWSGGFWRKHHVLRTCSCARRTKAEWEPLRTRRGGANSPRGGCIRLCVYHFPPYPHFARTDLSMNMIQCCMCCS